MLLDMFQHGIQKNISNLSCCCCFWIRDSVCGSHKSYSILV